MTGPLNGRPTGTHAAECEAINRETMDFQAV